jgi:hypothetical protein
VQPFKIHVFDDALLPTKSLSPEATVQMDFERTMLVQHAPPPNPSKITVREPPPSGAATMRIPAAAAATAVLEPKPALPAERVLVLKKLQGNAPDLVRLDQPNLMIGEPGRAAVLVRRRDTYFLSRLSRDNILRVNGTNVDASACAIKPYDIIEVGATKYQVISSPA